jgi:hypothetical protein
MLLRDVIERHRISNVEALRRLQRQLLSNPAGAFSVSKFHRDLRSQALPVAEETLYRLLSHLEDAFMVRLVAMHTASERQRMRNPRKIYPIDPGLIPVYERGTREHRGRSLETAIVIELDRRGFELGCVRVGSDLEVDVFAEHPVDEPLLLQVSLDTAAEATWDREIRALTAAADASPDARPLLITLDPTPPSRALPRRLEWLPAARWFSRVGDGRRSTRGTMSLPADASRRSPSKPSRSPTSSSPPEHAQGSPKPPSPNAWAPPRARSRGSRAPASTRRRSGPSNATPERWAANSRSNSYRNHDDEGPGRPGRAP